ncbi:tyrosine-type recombinase/integrase, partial [Bilophila wadsworthia]
LLHTAGRISEIREMAWEDVDLENRTVRLWTSKRRGGNRESRTIAMSPTLYSVLFRLYALRENERFVFEAPGTGLPYPRTTPRIKYLMKRLCEKAGIPFFAAHSLRHFMATHLKDPRRAQKVLGHMNIRTTEIYLHDLGVDREAAGIFEDITHGITHEGD